MGNRKRQKKTVRAGSQSASTAPSWRQKAVSMFPYLHHLNAELEDEEFSVYMLFHDLLPLCLKAHQSNSDWELQRIYDYAEWCWRQDIQGEDDLENAVDVAFYEHLSEFIPLSEIRKWVKPDIFEQLHEIFETTFTDKISEEEA
jgi:hypothetical protein